MAIAIDFMHPPSRTKTDVATHDFAWHAYAVVAAATMVVVGLIWDISWHMSIGRDTFWTPAHLLIQMGGLLAGLSSGALALHITFRGTQQEKESAVSFWGFRAPFGAWVSILGCGAMLTSAPFDDWWHNAYGLDVRIISPPHILLGLGMLGIVLGAMLRTLALQNGEDERTRRVATQLYAWSTGLFVSIIGIMLMEWTDRTEMHTASFYTALSVSMPIILVGTAVAGRSLWPATTAAAVYMALLLGTSLVLMLFPATPKLGPIYRDVTHYIPLDFPLLLVFPALAIDITWRRVRAWRPILAALLLGVVYFTVLVCVHWPFADFLMTHGRNWFFHTDNFVYWQSTASEKYSYVFRNSGNDESLVIAMLVPLLLSVLASRIGIQRGRWMTRVRR